MSACRLTVTHGGVFVCTRVAVEDCEECPMSQYIGLTEAQVKEVKEILAEADDVFCQCGHAEDDHRASDGNVCELAYACGCRGLSV